MRTLASIALTLCLARPAGAAPADVRNVRFQHISVEQGLSHAVVNGITQDQRGFMWFATQDGLSRYDGYTFTTYKHDPEDPKSLTHNVVWTLYESKDGKLWIGTEGGGLDMWDPASEGFVHHRFDKDDPKSLSSDRVRAIVETRDGAIWVGTDGGGLNRLNRGSGEFQRFRSCPSNANSLSSDRVRHLLEDRDGSLWISTDGGGINVLDTSRQNFRAYRHSDKDPASLGDDRVRMVYEDRDGTMWIATYQGGVNRFDRASRTFTRFRHDSGDPKSLSENRVRSILQDRSGTLWIGTDGGLNEWQPATGAFRRYKHSTADPLSLGEDRIMALYQDRGGVLWIATFGSGVDKWNASTTFFSLYRVDTEAKSTLTSNAVQALATDAKRNIWVGTVSGLNRLNRETGEVKAYTRGAAGRGLSDERVYAVFVDRGGFVWLGTLEGGLNRLDPRTETFTHYLNDPKDPSSVSGNGITSFAEDKWGRLWVGAFRGGLNRLDPGANKFVRFSHDPSVESSLGDDSVLAIVPDAEGKLWIGTDGGGLDRFDPQSGTAVHYRNDPQNQTSLSNDVVFCVLEDKAGNVWVGTRGGGLNRWSAADRKAGRVVFKHYREREGLPNDTVYGILEDEAGDLWLSTARGLSRFDVRAESFRNFDRSHGLQASDWNFGAYHKAAWGEMFFGGNEGFNGFLPERVRFNDQPPPVALTSFQKLGQKVSLGKDFSQVDQIKLTHRDYVVSFDFAALDFAAPEKNRYAYKLDGLDRDWIYSGSARRATYTNLAPGTYSFHVKAANGDGAWNEQGASVRLVVAPPWWRTWWAYGLYAAAFVGALRAYTGAQRAKLRREAEYSRRLEQQVRERTAELAARNEELQEVNKKLEDASLTDSLTGLANRRFLMEHIQKDIALVERRGVGPSGPTRADFALLMIDLDGLKAVNDNYGHGAGDRALIQMRGLLEQACRKSDTIVRWGGDEFLVVGRFADAQIAEALAERIRRSVEEHPFELGLERPVHLGCSVGWSMFPFFPDKPTLMSWEQVATIADRALYVAKSSGRNAWVGIMSTPRTPTRDIVHVINQRPEALAREGLVEFRTSLPEIDQLVFERQSPIAR